MIFDRKQIKANAREALSANYWPMVGIPVLASLILGGVGGISMIPVVGFIATVIFTPVFELPFIYFYYTVYAGEKPDVNRLFDGFRDKRFWRLVGGFWYMTLFITLWSFLLVIPGIVKAYSYSMMPYILMEDSEISVPDALKKSMEMTKGYKGKMFVLDLSFIGWAILTSITLGIVGIFYVVPYIGLARGGVYDTLKKINGGYDYVSDAAFTETTDSFSSTENF